MTPFVRSRVEQTLGELVASHEAGAFVYWRHNREVHDGRARAIAEYYAANNYDAGPQPLVVGTLPGGESYLLDGQHRLRAGELLGDAARRVAVEVVYENCADEAALRRLFRLINIGTPVPLQSYDEEVAAFIAATAPTIRTRWPRAYSRAEGASRPWFTDASLAHHLGNARCREGLMLGVLTPESFVEELEAVCEDVENDYRADPGAAGRRYGTTRATTVYPRALEKGFCAGVMVEWGDHVAGRIIMRLA